MLTGVHTDVLKLMVDSNQFNYAKRWLTQRPVFTLQEGIDGTSVLMYHYYSGCVYVGCKDFENAIRCFLQVLEVPQAFKNPLTASAICKMCLVSLIWKGELPSSFYTPEGSSVNFLTHHMPMLIQIDEAYQVCVYECVYCLFVCLLLYAFFCFSYFSYVYF